MSDLLEAAVLYAKLGWHVFPLAARSKMPAIGKKDGGNGLHDATNDPDRIEKWWTKHPNHNIGLNVGASGLYVVDIDGEKGQDALDELEKEHGNLPDTLVAATGKGHHFFFKHPEGKELGNTASKLGPNIDTRGVGGYVVLAPSVHPDGHLYEWVNEGTAPAELPKWIIDKHADKVWIPPTYTPSVYTLNVHPYVRRVWEQVQGDFQSSQQGTRNVALNTAAVKMGHWIASNSIDRGRVEQELTAIAINLGLGESEIRKTLESGIEAGLKQPAYPPDPKQFQHESQHQQDARLSEGTLNIQKGSSYGRKEIKYIWGKRIPIGKLTILAGPSGIGKSYTTLAVAAEITAGIRMLDSYGPVVDGECLFCTYEDDVEDTVGMRCDALGVNMDRCYFIEGVDTEHGQRQFGPQDVARIIDFVKTHPNIRMIAIDPLGSFMGSGVDVNSENEARAVLSTLVKTAADADAAVVIVAHFNKGTESSDPLHRIAGSQGITALPRSVLTVEWGEDGERLIKHVKSSSSACASTLGYHFDGTYQWTRIHREAEECRKWLFDTLTIKNGEMTLDEITSRAALYGMPDEELDIARDLLNPQIEEVNGVWVWSLR